MASTCSRQSFYRARRPVLGALVAGLLGAFGSSALADAPAAPVSPAAADPAPPAALTLDAAVHRAVARHPALGAAAHAVAGAERRVAEAQTAWLPRVTLDSNYRFQGPIPEFVIDTGLTIPGTAGPMVIRREAGSEHVASTGLKVGWRAFDFFARDARIRAAEAALRATAAEGAERAAAVAYSVRASYLAVLLYEEIGAVTARSLETARKALADEQTRKTAGLGDDLALAGAESRVAELEARQVDAQENALRLRTTLALLLGLGAGAPLALQDRLADLAPAAPDGVAPAADSPTFVRLAMSREAVERQRTALGRGYWPTLDLFASVAYQYPKTFIATEGWDFAYALGASLSWELFDGDLRRRQRQELAAKAAELAALEVAAREDLTRETSDAAARARTAAAARGAAERNVAAAEVYLRAAETALKAGTGTSLDVRRAAEAVDGARLALLKARFEAAMAAADRLRAEGRTGVAAATAAAVR